MATNELSREFQKTKLIDQVQRITDVQELKKIAIGQIEVNFRMKEQFLDWIESGWLPCSRK